MRRPFALPPGITPAQGRAASLAICARAHGRDEAAELLRCAGLIPDPGARPVVHDAQRKARMREAAK